MGKNLILSQEFFDAHINQFPDMKFLGHHISEYSQEELVAILNATYEHINDLNKNHAVEIKQMGENE